MAMPTLAVGYRALFQDYKHHDFEWDVTMHGPGARRRAPLPRIEKAA
jgi:hypothetical protein